MADDEHLEILMQGVDAWNEWRRQNPDVVPDLSYADLEAEQFDGGDFRSVNFFGANLSGEASFCNADFRGSSFEFADLLDSYCIKSDFRGSLFVKATLSEVDFSQADFRDVEVNSCTALEADFSGADLRGAQFNYSNLSHARFVGSDLRGADLTGSQMIGTCLRNADLTGARVYAVTPWEVDLEGAIQAGLVVTRGDRVSVTVDNLELAQFIHLLADSRALRRVIDTMTSRVVLVLGNFAKARADRLALLQGRIRERGLVPLSIDVGKARGAAIMETATLLARMSRFVVADLTGAAQVMQILEAVIPEVGVPVLSVVSSRRAGKDKLAGAWKYSWFFAPTPYGSSAELAALLRPAWFDRADKKREELQARRLAAPRV